MSVMSNEKNKRLYAKCYSAGVFHIRSCSVWRVPKFRTRTRSGSVDLPISNISGLADRSGVHGEELV